MKKYTQYNAVDFSQESSFIRWVKQSKIEGDMDWDQWIEENPDKSEIITNAKKIVTSINFNPEVIPTNAKDKIWNKINEEVDLSTKVNNDKVTRGKFIRLIPFGIAAAIAFLSIMIYTGGGYDTTLVTSMAEVNKVFLPDGSEVHVNADSRLSYDKKTWDKNRSIELDGEAFFKVKKGSDFTVNTSHGHVKVLGTSFNVYTRKESFHVICETGKVKVTTSQKETILTPQQSIAVINDQYSFVKEVNNKASRSNWQTGIYLYDQVELREVIEELERQLDVEIKIDPSLTSQKYTGSFDRNQKLEALSEVLWPLGLEYKKEGNTIVVTQ